jgi:uncharacterized membrane protein YkoI
VKRFAIAGLVVALVAFIMAAIGLSTGTTAEATGPAPASAADLARVEKTVGELASKLDTVAARVDKIASSLAALSDRTNALAGTVEEVASREVPPPAAAAAVGIDDEKLAEAVRNEVRGMFDRMRNQRGNQRPAGGQQQQQQPRDRVAADQIPDSVKTAAVAAAPGFEVDHAHQAGTTDDGKAIYEVDGSKDDQRYVVRVTADGTVVSQGERQRGRGGRGGRPQQGAQPGANDQPGEPDQF